MGEVCAIPGPQQRGTWGTRSFLVGRTWATRHKVYEELIPEEEHRTLMFQHLLKPPQNPEQMQEWAVSAKRLVDLYLTIAAHRVWQETILKAKDAKSSSSEPEYPRRASRSTK